MSTFKEISESKTTVMIKEKEGFFLSLSKDLMTFSFLALCIYISQGSSWWTFFTGVIFIAFGSAKLTSTFNRSTTTFDTPKDAIAYLQKLEVPKDQAT